MSDHDTGTDTTGRILSLIRSKNRCLERLMDATQAFLAVPLRDIASAEESPAAPLRAYDGERAAALKALELFDRKLNERISELSAAEKTEAFLANVRGEMNRNETLLHSIFNADDVVFRKIADAQARIGKLMQENRKSREILTRFKSTWINEGGDEVDTTL